MGRGDVFLVRCWTCDSQIHLTVRNINGLMYVQLATYDVSRRDLYSTDILCSTVNLQVTRLPYYYSCIGAGSSHREPIWVGAIY